MAKKVFLCRFSQESNAFNPLLAEEKDFTIIKKPTSTMLEDGTCGLMAQGAYEVLSKNGLEVILGDFYWAGSGAPINEEVINAFIDSTIQDIKNIKDLSAVCIVMHGASMSKFSDDVCGDIIESIRKVVGNNVIISVSFDLHANVTEKTMLNADYVSGYQTYPHLDLYETGRRSAERIVDFFNGKKYYMAMAKVPMIAPAHAYTTSTRELKKLMDKAKRYKESGKIIDYSIFQVQPWLDVKEFASTVIITAKDKETALSIANELAVDEFNLRKDLQGKSLISVEEVVLEALNNKTGKPVVLCDSADSPNAGANGDSAFVLEKLLPYKDKLKCALAVVDSKAVDKAYSLGVGNSGDFVIGGAIAPKLSNPVTIKNATVVTLSDGLFTRVGPQEKGRKEDNGLTAVIKTGNIYIHLSYKGKIIGDRGYFTSVGIDVTKMDLVSVKACTSFRAGYEPISAKICNAVTKGAAGTDLLSLPFTKRPKPLYPFEEIEKSDITKAKIYR